MLSVMTTCYTICCAHMFVGHIRYLPSAIFFYPIMPCPPTEFNLIYLIIVFSRWTEKRIEGQNAPQNHITFTFGKSLFFFGGDFKAQSLLQNGRSESGEWTLLTLLDTNNEPFDKFTSHACSAKLDLNRFLVLGGTYSSENGAKIVLPDIFEVNVFNRKVQKVGEMNHARTQHACTMITKSFQDEEGKRTFSRAVLISGGVSKTNEPETIVKSVELFILDNRESIDLTNEMQTPRFKHHMISLGEQIYALGGETVTSNTKSIEKFTFDKDTYFAALTNGTWTSIPKSLKSSSTSGLAVTTLPKSAVECNNEETCECGMRRQSRIIGGAAVSRSGVFQLKTTDFPKNRTKSYLVQFNHQEKRSI